MTKFFAVLPGREFPPGIYFYFVRLKLEEELAADERGKRGFFLISTKFQSFYPRPSAFIRS